MNLLAKNVGNLDLKVILRDLIVVALGILIAISVDGWVKDRADRREEQQILIGLKSEFQANREQLERVSDTWHSAMAANEQLLQLVGTSLTGNDAERIRQLAIGLYVRSYDPRSGQLKSVISSGKLSLVSNADLRALLADWPDIVDDLLDDQWFMDNFFYEQQHATLFRVVPLRPASLLEPDYKQLFYDVGFENLLDHLATTLNFMVTEKDEVIAASDAIISLIDAELK